MFKKWLIEKIFTFVIGAVVVGIGIWYLSSSIGGASLSYTNIGTFMNQIGADNGDISSVNGCFLCGYINDLFGIMGRATEMFWNGVVKHLWILMAVGFGLFIIMHTLNFFREQASSKDIKDLTNAEPKVEFKKWFDKVWQTGLRVMLAGALIGALNGAGNASLRTVTNIVVTPVMYIGSNLSMAATGVISGGHCELATVATNEEEVLKPVLQPFMCAMGNLNTVMLAGAGGGFALMNYAWLGLGGGVFTWIAGLALVLLFLFIGFDLLFQVLSVVFKLVFIIIFMPLMIAAAAFEEVWAVAKNVMTTAIKTLINSAVTILKISLKITIIYGVVFFAADKFFPGPEDGFSAISPPLFGQNTPLNADAQTMSVISVFTTCEQASIVNGEIDKDTFVACFNTQKSMVEARYPGAFDFMEDGFDFLLFMIGVFILYFWVVSPKIDQLLSTEKAEKELFDYGQWLKDTGKMAYESPGKMYNKISDILKKG